MISGGVSNDVQITCLALSSSTVRVRDTVGWARMNVIISRTYFVIAPVRSSTLTYLLTYLLAYLLTYSMEQSPS